MAGYVNNPPGPAPAITHYVNNPTSIVTPATNYTNSPGGPPGQGDLLAWYDAQNINLLGNVGVADADPVGTWKNAAASGAAYDQIQVNAGTKPTFRKIAAAGKINNLSAVESTDGLRHMQSAAFTLVAQPLTWAWVFRSTTAGTQVLSTGGAANTNQTLFTTVNPSMFAGTTQNPALPIVANTWEAAVARYDAASSTWTLNASTVSGFGSVGTSGIDQIGLFWNPPETGGVGWVGFIAECLIWTTAPPVSAIIAYFNARYGVTPQ